MTYQYDPRIIDIIGFDDACVILADLALIGYGRQITPVVYLYGFRGEGDSFERVWIGTDRPRFAEMVILTHIPRNMTRTQLTAWFNAHLRREPILQAVIRTGPHNGYAPVRTGGAA